MTDREPRERTCKEIAEEIFENYSSCDASKDGTHVKDGKKSLCDEYWFDSSFMIKAIEEALQRERTAREQLEQALRECLEALSLLGDSSNYWSGYEVDGAKYPDGLTIWRGQGQPDEIADQTINKCENLSYKKDKEIEELKKVLSECEGIIETLNSMAVCHPEVNAEAQNIMSKCRRLIK